ncbi:pyruvate dehydrogenase (acetyl-transferring), homodimeric type [Pseudomonadota bacterium]
MNTFETGDGWSLEKDEWLEALRSVYREQGGERTRELLEHLQESALRAGIDKKVVTLNTPYRNSILPEDQPPYLGELELEKRIEDINRWNAMAMVLRANDAGTGVGGHIATYASAATLWEVGFNHIFRNRSAEYGGDIVNVQPHAAPGVYARAFLEGRLNRQQIENFRRELQPGGGLSSYPHPRRMPDLWPCPTASMGLSTAMSIYMARFAKYLENRGLKPRNGGKIWCMIGDGEADEPEVLGTINIAARERLDNLVMIVNCNLQRLDGPVRGNSKVIQELERTFRGANWNVVKVIWGSAWDSLLAADKNGVLQRRMDEALDGDYQMYSVLSGEEVRKHWIRDDAELERLMKPLSDEEIQNIDRGGHDHRKLYAAYQEALATTGKPTVILVKTVKGRGMGSSGQGRNASHQKKTMGPETREECAARFGIPLPAEEVRAAQIYQPASDSAEIKYLQEHREALGGYQPTREVSCPTLQPPSMERIKVLTDGNERPISTTMAMVRLLSQLLRDEELGQYIVPIVPDEARTFGMDGLFRQVGIYSVDGQKYLPEDADTLSPYRESEKGQILQEGICEAGAIASFLAAGTAYAHFGVPTIPFYFFYSIFGFQRVGDLIYAGGDAMSRGFLIGGTAGRSTLNGEGLQHQDGHSHVLASTVPSVVSYDPAFGYELALIVRDGIKRMYQDEEAVIFYVTTYNENYPMPAMPEGIEEGVLRGIYRFKSSSIENPKNGRVQLFGSGSLMQQALQAQQELEEQGIAADVWSVTSYTELYRDGTACEKHNLQNTGSPRRAFLARALDGVEGPFVAVSDYMCSLPESVSKWIPGKLVSLGTDGFGLSESRKSLRGYFGIDANHIVEAARASLGVQG